MAAPTFTTLVTPGIFPADGDTGDFLQKTATGERWAPVTAGTSSGGSLTEAFSGNVDITAVNSFVDTGYTLPSTWATDVFAVNIGGQSGAMRMFYGGELYVGRITPGPTAGFVSTDIILRQGGNLSTISFFFATSGATNGNLLIGASTTIRDPRPLKVFRLGSAGAASGDLDINALTDSITTLQGGDLFAAADVSDAENDTKKLTAATLAAGMRTLAPFEINRLTARLASQLDDADYIAITDAGQQGTPMYKMLVSELKKLLGSVAFKVNDVAAAINAADVQDADKLVLADVIYDGQRRQQDDPRIRAKEAHSGRQWVVGY